MLVIFQFYYESSKAFVAFIQQFAGITIIFPVESHTLNCLRSPANPSEGERTASY